MVRSETPTAPAPGNVALFSAAIRRGPETTINARWVLRSISGVNLSQYRWLERQFVCQKLAGVRELLRIIDLEVQRG